MIAVETSVWVAALRADAERPRDFGNCSTPTKRDRAKLRSGLSALPLAYPTDFTWRLMDRWTDRASGAGAAFGIGDLLIAAIAHEVGALVWSLDGAFARLERLCLVGCYEP